MPGAKATMDQRFGLSINQRPRDLRASILLEDATCSKDSTMSTHNVRMMTTATAMTRESRCVR